MGSRFTLLALMVLGFLISYNEILEAKASYRLAHRDEEQDSSNERSYRSKKNGRYGRSKRRSEVVNQYSEEGNYRVSRRNPSNYSNDERSYRGGRRPASAPSLERAKFGVTKAFFGNGNNSFSQVIGVNLGFSRDIIQALGYGVTASYHIFDHSVAAARVDFNATYALNAQLSALGGLNYNQFLGNNMSNVQPGLGYQIGADYRIDAKWGVQGNYLNLKGSSLNGRVSSDFEATGIEISAYINF